MMLQKNSAYSTEEIRQILMQTAQMPAQMPMGGGGEYIGAGIINSDAALNLNSVSTATTEITYPNDYEFFSQQQTIDIIGSAMGDSYVLEYGAGSYPTEWFVIGSGTTVDSGVLGTLNVEALVKGQYSIKLTVSDSNGIATTDIGADEWAAGGPVGPVPEIPTILMLSIGLLGMGGFFLGRRRTTLRVSSM